MFELNEEYGVYEADINGIGFECEYASEELEEKAKKLAFLYHKKLPDIIEFILPELQGLYGRGEELSEESVKVRLGRPQIDLDADTVTYCDHAFDDEHIFIIAFEDDFEELIEFEIDG